MDPTQPKAQPRDRGELDGAPGGQDCGDDEGALFMNESIIKSKEMMKTSKQAGWLRKKPGFIESVNA